MNKEIADKWVEALNNNEYQKGSGVLRSGNTFCVLGVLCDLHSKATTTNSTGNWRLHGETSYRYLSDGKLNSFSLPPKEVLNWAGIQAGNCCSLAVSNDSGKSFKELADFISKNWISL